MSKQTAMIVTIVVAVLTLCCSMTCCGWGAMMAAGGGQQWDDFYMEWYYGIPVICLGILVWIVPLLLWFFLVRGQENTAEEHIAI